MIESILKIVEGLHGLIIIISALGFFLFWFRTRLWLPRYVHIMAILSFLLGLGMLHMVPSDAPIYKDAGWFALPFIILLFPAMVYFFFIFYGGQSAAYENNKSIDKIECGYCGNEYYDSDICPNCGQLPKKDKTQPDQFT